MYISELIELLAHDQVHKCAGKKTNKWLIVYTWRDSGEHRGRHIQLPVEPWPQLQVPAILRIKNGCINWRLVENHQGCWHPLEIWGALKRGYLYVNN